LPGRVWPQLKSKALNAVAAHLGVSFTHHNAAEDARACAEVALAAADRVAALEVADIPHRLDVWRPAETRGFGVKSGAESGLLGGQGPPCNLYPLSSM